MAKKTDNDKYNIQVGLETDEASIKSSISSIKAAIKSLNSISAGENEADGLKDYDSIVTSAKYRIGSLVRDMQKLTNMRDATATNKSLSQSEKNITLGDIDKSLDKLGVQYNQLNSLLIRLETQAKKTSKELGSLNQIASGRKTAYKEWLETGNLTERVEKTATSRGPKELYEEAKNNVTQIAKMAHENYETTRKETLLQRHYRKELDKRYKLELRITEEKKKQSELSDIVAVGLFKRIAKVGLNAFKSLTEAGSRYTETNSRFTRLLGQYANEAEGYALRIANAFGRNLTEVKGSLSTIYSLLRNSNIESEKAVLMSANLVSIANDLASVWDTDVDQAINAVVSGLQGLPKAMKTYGVYLTESEIKEYLVEAGYASDELTGNLSTNQRTFGVFLKTLKDSGYAIGDFKDTMMSVANQSRILRSMFDGVKQTLGSMLNEVLSPILYVVNSFLKFINSLLNELNKMPKIVKIIVGVLILLTTILPIVAGGFLVAKYYGGVFKKQMERISKEMVNATGATKIYGKALTFLTTKWKSLASWLTIGLTLILSLLYTFGAFDNYLEESSKGVDDLGKNINNLKKTLAGFDDVNTLTFTSKSDKNNESLGDLSVLSLDWLTTTFDNNVGEITDGVNDISDSFKDLSLQISILSSAMAVIKVTSLLMAKTFKEKAKVSAVGFTAALAAIGVSIYSIVDAWNSSMPTWAKIVNTILGVTAAVGGLIMAWGILTKNVRMATIGGVIAAGGIGSSWAIKQFTTPKEATPQLATGAIARSSTGGTRVTVGEGLHDEAIIPLGTSPQFTDMKSDIASAVLQGLNGAKLGGGQPINITINVDEDYIYKAYNRQAKLYGGR